MKPTCIFCGEPTEDFEYIARSKVWHCNSNECLKALADEIHDAYLLQQEDEAKERWEANYWKPTGFEFDW